MCNYIVSVANTLNIKHGFEYVLVYLKSDLLCNITTSFKTLSF